MTDDIQPPSERQKSNLGATSQPRNYFSRREQYRLIAMVFSLMLVGFMVVEAGKPSNWKWFFGNQTGSATEEPSQFADHDMVVDTTTDLAIDRQPSLPAGVFVSPADLQDGSLTANENGTATKLSSGDAPTEEDYSAVKDDTVFRAEESAAWYKLLTHLNKTDDEALRGRSLGTVSFAQLHSAPESFRGRVIDLEGVVCRSHFLQAPKNDFGIDGYWQCWLRPTHSQNPIVVYALNLPQGFPEGMKVREAVSFTAVFFKRWAYASQSGSRVAPLVVAARGQWSPAETAQSRPAPSLSLIARWIAGCAALAIGIAWLANRFATQSRPSRNTTDPVFDTIGKSQPIVSIEESTAHFLDDLVAGESDSRERQND